MEPLGFLFRVISFVVVVFVECQKIYLERGRKEGNWEVKRLDLRRRGLTLPRKFQNNSRFCGTSLVAQG